MAGARHIYQFVSSDGLTTATFPLARAEFESDQELRNAIVTAVGMDYAVDLHGQGRAPLGTATERVRALLTGDDADDLDDTADALTSAVLEIGRGNVTVLRERRYLFNPGALQIGQFVIWDREARRVQFRHVEW